MLPPKWYQFFVALFASLGSALYGYDLGVIAGSVDSPNFEAQFAPSAAEKGAVVALFTAGAFFGAGFAGPLADWLGRRLTLMFGGVVFILGGGLQTGAKTLDFLYSGRGESRDSDLFWIRQLNHCSHRRARCWNLDHDYSAVSSGALPSQHSRACDVSSAVYAGHWQPDRNLGFL